MKRYSFYHLATGALAAHSYGANDAADLVLNIPPDYGVIDGHHDHLSKRVDLATGELVDYQPPRPSPDHEWNAETKRWQLTAAAAARVDRRSAALARIAELEASQPRVLREHALGFVIAAERLKEIDAEIASLRSILREKV